MKIFHKTFTFFNCICFGFFLFFSCGFDPLNPLFHPQFRLPFFVLVGCFFLCVCLGERFVRTATQLCTTPPLHSPLFSLSRSLSLSSSFAVATTKQTNGGGCGGVRAVVVLICRCCWTTNPPSFLLFSV